MSEMLEMWNISIKDQRLCNYFHVKGVKDYLNMNNWSKAMYVRDIRDGSNYMVYVMLFMSEMLKIYKHVFAHNFLNIQRIFNPEKVLKSWDIGLSNHTIKYCIYLSMLEMSEIDQVHLRAVMLFMTETSEIVIIFNIHRIWWYGWKALSLSFSKLFFGLKIHWILRKLWAKTCLTTTKQQCYSCLMSEMLEMWYIYP